MASLLVREQFHWCTSSSVLSSILSSVSCTRTKVESQVMLRARVCVYSPRETKRGSNCIFPVCPSFACFSLMLTRSCSSALAHQRDESGPITSRRFVGPVVVLQTSVCGWMFCPSERDDGREDVPVRDGGTGWRFYSLLSVSLFFFI